MVKSENNKQKFKSKIYGGVLLCSTFLQVAVPMTTFADDSSSSSESVEIVSVDNSSSSSSSSTTSTESSQSSTETKTVDVDTSATDSADDVTEIQLSVDNLQSKVDELTETNKKLDEESQQLTTEIAELSSEIVERRETLEEQADKLQKQGNGGVGSFVTSLLQTGSISQASAQSSTMKKLATQNAELLKAQESDMKILEEKQKENQNAINTFTANQATLADDTKDLAVKQAELKVAQLKLQLANATDESTKANLNSQITQAESDLQTAKDAQAAQEAEQAATAAKIEADKQASASATSNSSSSSSSSTSSESVTTGSTTLTADYSQSNTYPVGQCTWGAKALAPWVGNYWGNARDWIASAQAAGFSVGTTPKVGAVACWPNDGGGYGHVAVVSAVYSSTSIEVQESNYAGNQYISNFRGTFNPTDSTWGGGTVYYIYPN